MSTRLSVIIPGYDTPKAMWQRCVRSVLASVSDEDEVFCVDDGSSVPVEKDWFPADSRITMLRHNENMGLPSGRNTAIERARGKYLAFVDSDDEVIPGAYDEAITTLEQDGTDIAVYGVKVIWFNNGLYKDDIVARRNIGVVDAQSLAWIYRACLFDYAWNKVYRRSFLDAHDLRFEPAVRTGEDTVFNCSCVVAGAKWSTVDCIGSIYYRYDGSMLSRYVPNIRATHRRKLEARAAARAMCPGIDEILGNHVEVTEQELDAVEWRNMWMRSSPVSLRDRWRFLRCHPAVSRGNPLMYFASTAVYWFLRRHFYIRPVRRWQVRRLFTNVLEVKA